MISMHRMQRLMIIFRPLVVLSCWPFACDIFIPFWLIMNGEDFSQLLALILVSLSEYLIVEGFMAIYKLLLIERSSCWQKTGVTLMMGRCLQYGSDLAWARGTSSSEHYILPWLLLPQPDSNDSRDDGRIIVDLVAVFEIECERWMVSSWRWVGSGSVVWSRVSFDGQQ